ncbi:Hypp214 [Branchiostoma lanceolatum]|uniref:Hypp214 protein n=1 Tax=Branchiostoma lanceolatum TaxID=7740 RepID=A0A8J9YPY0_BRALA|nr:Hypp214 [Branchiostoma lanceolatum]
MISLVSECQCCDPGNMANKMKRLLVLLLIILKETGPTTACSSSCSSSYNSFPQSKHLISCSYITQNTQHNT